MGLVETLVKPKHNGDVFVKYETYNGVHFVYVECGKQVRRLAFPTQSLAMDFTRKIEVYAKLKVF